MKPNLNQSPFKIRPFFLDTGHFFPDSNHFSFKSVNFWHNKHRIWSNQWFLITICQRSRCVSKHSGDNRVHLKPTTTRRQPEPMNPLLLWVGCELKNHPPDLVQVNCGLGKNPTRPTHGQPYTLVPKVLKPNKLPLWQSVTKHITKNKMLKVKQPIQLKSSN